MLVQISSLHVHSAKVAAVFVGGDMLAQNTGIARRHLRNPRSAMAYEMREGAPDAPSAMSREIDKILLLLHSLQKVFG